MDSVLLYLLGVLVIVLGLALSIALHEIGHLVPAKLFGVKVTQYMIGFGRTLFSVRRGETEYGLKAIPLGGYISMIGMFPPARPGGKMRNASTGFFNTMVQEARESSEKSVGADEQRAFYRLPIWKRIVVMLGGPFMNLVLAIVFYAIVLMGFGIAQTTTTIGSVSECVLPATSSRTTCEASDPKAPGAAAGILPGDRVISIDGTEITTWDQATAMIRESPGEPLAMVVERDGEEVAISATPLLTERYVTDERGTILEDAAGNPRTQEVGFLGIGPTAELVQQPASAVLPMVGENVAAVTGIILNLPQRLIDVANAAFGPGERDPNGPVSVVGVGRLAGEIASLEEVPVASRVASLLGVLASLNVALLVFNLVPLMPLDGGHVAGALWEGLRRAFAKVFRRRDPGPVDTAKLMPLTFAVVILLGAMSVLLIYADIVKPISIL
ncbi:site-2 protease family protein [Naasia sp. SYSU D00948]|uniref:M50 family metallopeptidase n=1 Tax=Naasia sp. SYSU D00948 TaxID=2817379 RepID=UPI001B3163FD|nr:site-2 protease family protein [Naasia sp. SYSU D00948]